MYGLSELIAKHPVVPYIRESEYAIRKPWSLQERRLLDYLLFYVQEGQMIVIVDGVEHIFHEGEFCFLQPDTLHSFQGVTNTITPFAHLDLFYHPEREKSFPTRAGQIDLTAYRHLQQPRLNDIAGIEIGVRLMPKHPTAFRDTMLRMIQTWRHRDTLCQLEAQHLATELVIDILREHTSPEMHLTDSVTAFNWITPFMSLRLAEPLSVQDMAERAGLSISRFNTVFRKHFDVTPHQYLLRLRLQYARELLSGTTYPLEEIAAYCGFADIHHFAKSFRKTVGMAPGAYRKIQNPPE